MGRGSGNVYVEIRKYREAQEVQENVLQLLNIACQLISAPYGHLMLTKSDCKKKKSVPLQGWSGPEGSRKLRFPDFKTTAQGGGKVVSLTHRPHLPPGNSPGTHFC